MMKKESMVGGNRIKKETKSKNKRTTKPLALPLACIVIVMAMPAPALSFIASTPANNANAYQQNSPISSITILNPQSYPSVGENWTVRFNTTGQANLTITPVNNTYFDVDIHFSELRCGDGVVNATYGVYDFLSSEFQQFHFLTDFENLENEVLR